METADYLIIGGGIMGITIARELKKDHPDASVLLIEKERDIALHASGRNSGVLHAGFYYTADSLKARFTREGNRAMRAYCVERGLKINECGKLVVCQSEADMAGLEELLRRGRANGVNLEMIGDKEAREIEPDVITHEAALWSPDTASVDPREVTAALADDARHEGVEIRLGCAYLGRGKQKGRVRTSLGEMEAGYVVNMAGLYADKVAADFGFSRRYRILPFKGLYLYAGNQAIRPRVHIYPVPDLKHPFLGVHFTLTVDGRAKIGPTAIPAFWRENYQGFDGFSLTEATEIMLREARMWLGNRFGFRHLAFREMQKYRKSFMVDAAQKMYARTRQMEFDKWGPPGIRAQLVDIERDKLEMDFVYEGDENSLHLLNAVSPAFTCSLAISRFLADRINELTG